MVQLPQRVMLLVCALILSATLLTTCAPTTDLFSAAPLHITTLTRQPQQFIGKQIDVEGAYIWRPGEPQISVLATGYSTLDNGLDAQPLGEPLIWLEGFPAEISAELHQPGDAVYGMVRIHGLFESGAFGPDGMYVYRIVVDRAESISRVERSDVRLEREAAPEGQVSFFDLLADPGRYNGQVVTVRGYYFWNSLIYVLAEGISTENDQLRSNPQPIGEQIWMEGFPPDKSAQLNLGPNNTYVWGLVEVTGTFQAGGGFGRDGRYQYLLTVQSAEIPR